MRPVAFGHSEAVSKRRRTKPRPRPTTGGAVRAASVLVPAAGEPTVTPDAAGHPDQPSVGGEQVRLLVGVIATGGLDEHLTTVSAAIHQRHRQLLRTESNRAAARIDVGVRVRLNHSIRPLYLHGATGTVVGWVGQRAVVHLDAPIGRFTSREVRCPPVGLDRLPS